MSQVNFWKGPTFVNIPVDIMVSPDERDDLERILRLKGVSDATIVMDNVQNYIDNEERGHSLTVRDQTFNYNIYHRIEEVGWLVTLLDA